MKSTKKSLFLSVMSMLLCVVLLLGTTFAWFTDSVTSGTNRITAGSLDVELYHTDNAVDDEKVTESTKLFDDVTLWEPGAAAFETLTIKNVGTLAVNYQLNVLVGNETKVNGHGLSEVLKIGSFAGTVEDANRDDVLASITNWTALASFTVSGSLDAKSETDPVTYVIAWPNSEDDNLFNMNNENQGKVLSIDLGVKLVAGQKTKESDSFDDQYDYNAFIQVNPNNFESIIENLKGGENLYLEAGTYTITANEKLKITKNNVTIVGAGIDATIINAADKTCSGQAGLLVSANNVTIANLTVKSAPADETTAKNTAPIKVTDLLGTDGDHMIENFKLENVALEGSKGHGLNLHGVTNAVIDGVDVRTYSKCAISFAKATATVTNTKTANAGWGDIGCMYADKDSYNTPSNITIGEGNDFGKGLIYSERPSSAQGGKDTITFADSSAWVVTSTDAGISAVAAVAKIGNTGYATLNDAITEANAGDTITLLKDASLTAAVTVTKNLTIEGNGKTITGDENNVNVNFTVNGATLTLKNVTLDKFGYLGQTNSGVAVVKVNGDADASTKVVANNVKVTRYCRTAFDIRSGVLEIEGCELDPANTNGNYLNKGVQLGYGNNSVAASIKNTTIKNCLTKYKDWGCGAIEVFDKANATIDNVTIENCATSVYVTSYTNPCSAVFTNTNVVNYVVDGANAALTIDDVTYYDVD